MWGLALDAKGEMVVLVTRGLDRAPDHCRSEKGDVDLPVVHQSWQDRNLLSAAVDGIQVDLGRTERPCSQTRRSRRLAIRARALRCRDPEAAHPTTALVIETLGDYPGPVTKVGLLEALPEGDQRAVDRVGGTTPEAAAQLVAPSPPGVVAAQGGYPGAPKIEPHAGVEALTVRRVGVAEVLRVLIQRQRIEVVGVERNESLEVVLHRADPDAPRHFPVVIPQLGISERIL